MAHVRSYRGVGSWISQSTHFTKKLGGVALPLAPTLENVVFIGSELTSTERTRGGQRGIWCLPEIFAHGIASQSKLNADLDNSHPLLMKFLHPLIQFPFLQEPGLGFALVARSRRVVGQRALDSRLQGRSFHQANASANQEVFDCVTYVRQKVPAISNLGRLWGSPGRSIHIHPPAVTAHVFHFW